MIKKERCKICNKKLVNGFCTDCGLQQSYLTDVTEDREVFQPEKKKKSSKVVWVAVSILLMVLPMLLSTPPFQILIYSVQQEQVVTSVPESAYENVSREPAADGMSTEKTLKEGNYIVGIDIPEGVYQASVVSRRANFDLEDQFNEIDLFYWLNQESDTDSSYLRNLRLYEGAILIIEAGEISFTSSNAQIDMLQVLPQNEDLQTYHVSDGAVAGVDFPEGTYDITVCGGERGMVRVSFNDRNEDALGFSDIMENDEDELTYYHNVEFPKGTMIEIADVEIALVPSTRNSLMR